MKTNIKKAVIDVMGELFGFEEKDLLENIDLNLVEEGIIDSMSSATLIVHLEEKLKKSIDTDQLEMDDFETVNTIIRAIERVM